MIIFVPQEKEQELEQLTKELRQVNLQQFIQQTGTKVTVLPAQPAGETNGTWTCTHTHTHPHTHTLAFRSREESYFPPLDSRFLAHSAPLWLPV